MDDQQFRRKLKGLISQFSQGRLGFSRINQGLLNGFVSLEPAATAYGDVSIELGTVSYYSGVLQCTSDAEKSLERLQRALSIHDRLPFLESEQEWIARIECSANHSRLDRNQAGLEGFLQLTQALYATALNAELRVTCLQKIGYYMHLFGAFESALAHNEASWHYGSKVLGHDNHTVQAFRLNMAESNYALGRVADAEHILQELRLSAARTNDFASECEICFKLGVLAHGTGRDAEAENLMRQAVEAAEKSDRKETVGIYRGHLDELHRRVAARRTQRQ